MRLNYWTRRPHPFWTEQCVRFQAQCIPHSPFYPLIYLTDGLHKGHDPRFALVTTPFPPFPLIFYTHNKYYILVMSPTGPGALGTATDENKVSEAAT